MASIEVPGLKMPAPADDAELLYRRVISLLQQGLRTATYKFATMTALVDFSANSHDSRNAADHLPVPIADLARRVIALYWPQVRPYEGRTLKQSTQATSRILDGVLAFQISSSSESGSIALDEAALRLPDAYRRLVDSVTITLAQQPLPRLQRLPGAPKSVPFLYDDSFLHDNVSRAALQAHGSMIQLKPAVAQCLAIAKVPLDRTLKSMWIDDVMRLNGIAAEQRPAVAEHLFGPDHVVNMPTVTPPIVTRETAAGESPAPTTVRPKPPISASFAERLNFLFESHESNDHPPYTTREVATQLRMRGLGINESQLTNLRLGLQDAPSPRIVKALAAVFGADPAYLAGQGLGRELGLIRKEVSLAIDEHAESPAAMRQEGGEEGALRATDYASTAGRHRATSHDEFDYPRPRGATAEASNIHDIGVIGTRLDALFERHLTPTGNQYTNGEVASALQDDGFAITEGLIARLRAGSGLLPSIQTLDALAFFFDVDVDHFAVGRHAAKLETADHERGTELQIGVITSDPRLVETTHGHQTQRDPVATIRDIADILSALSKAARQSLEVAPADVEQARTLVGLINEVGAILKASAGQEIVLQPDLAARISRYRPRALADEIGAEPETDNQTPGQAESRRADRWTPQEAGEPGTPGKWTLRSFIAAVEHPGDRAFLNTLLELFRAQTEMPGSHPPFWYGAAPRGGLFLFPFRLQHPPFHLLIDNEGRLVVRGNWRTFPKVAGHPGFAELAELLGQIESGPTSSVRVEHLDAEELWDVAEVTARAINS